jgi:hypothetical protein
MPRLLDRCTTSEGVTKDEHQPSRLQSPEETHRTLTTPLHEEGHAIADGPGAQPDADHKGKPVQRPTANEVGRAGMGRVGFLRGGRSIGMASTPKHNELQDADAPKGQRPTGLAYPMPLCCDRRSAA